jgi:alpha-beta hydrolase superfamily lysophospholipase
MITPAPRIALHNSSDGYRSAVRIWDAERPPARVVLLHGIISHGGWYHASCRALAQAGFEVHFLDRRGSGLRGDVPRSWRTWPADVESYLELLPSDAPRLLMGISWGGKLAAAVARQRPDLVDGLGLLCPGLFARKGANALQRLVLEWAGRRWLRMRTVSIPLGDPALFTDEPGWRKYIADDPLTLRRVTLRFALEDLSLSRYAAAAPEQIRAPVLLALAGRDRIIDNDRVRAFVARVSAQRQVLDYTAAAHTLEYEPDPEPYFRDLVAWCRQVAAGRSHLRPGAASPPPVY